MKKLLITALFALGLLSAHAQKVFITVDQSGKGDFRTIQEAVYAVRDMKPGDPAEIFVRNGTYREKLIIPANKCNIVLRGEDRERTVIAWGDYAALENMGTFRTWTLMVAGNDITIENLTIENTAGEVGQAVALHIEGDRVIVRNCRLVGNQDTLYTGRGGARIWFGNCYIEGTTDFIFGASAVWFEGCTIHCKRDSFITAASTRPEDPWGYVFNRCKITVGPGVTAMYLGRPWRQRAQTLFMHCELPVQILPGGWHNWDRPAEEHSTQYREYKNYGPGADTTRRVAWSRQLSDAEVKRFDVPRDTSFTLWQTWIKERKNRPYIVPIWPSLPTGVKAWEGEVYSTLLDRRTGIRELHLNIYRPDDETLRPALLMVHGGGWNSGSLEMEVPMAQALAARGWVTVPVEYRLIPEALYPAAVNDLKDAIRWLRANAERFGIDPARIAISGCSAGGQLANLVGTTNGMPEYENARVNNDFSSAVQAVIDIDGISDFIQPETLDRAREARSKGDRPVDMVWLGGTFEEVPDNWIAASPLYHVGPHSVPVSFINSSLERFHQGRDQQIAKLEALGIYSEVHTFPDTPHPFWLFHPWFEKTVGLMDAFLKKIFDKVA